MSPPKFGEGGSITLHLPPPLSGCPRSPPVVADAANDEEAFAVGVGMEEVPPPSERTRCARNSLQSPAAPSSESIGSSDDGPPPSPSPRDDDNEHEHAVIDVATTRIERVGCGWGGHAAHQDEDVGGPGGRRAIVTVERSSARREQQQQQQAERMNGNALSTRARQLPAVVTL